LNPQEQQGHLKKTLPNDYRIKEEKKETTSSHRNLNERGKWKIWKTSAGNIVQGAEREAQEKESDSGNPYMGKNLFICRYF